MNNLPQPESVVHRRSQRAWLLLLTLLSPLLRAGTGPLVVSADFPGGSAEVVSIDPIQRHIRFIIPENATGGWQTWWFLKVSGIEPGQSIALELLNGRAPARRAVYSSNGTTWSFTELAKVSRDKRLTYTQQINAPEAYFAWYVPYVPETVERLADQFKHSPHVAAFELCRSEEGRPVTGFRFGPASRDARVRPAIWIQARQHAWEAGASWVAHGLIEWLASDDPRAASLREQAEIVVIPIMDVDSVARGAGGKDQTPHDHNRDWKEQPHWNSVKAAMEQLKRFEAAGRLSLFIDLHDPGWAGQAIEFWCHGYGQLPPERKGNTDRFLALAKEAISGPLPFAGKIVDRYTLTTPSSALWVRFNTRESVVTGTFEFPVAPPASFTGNPPAYHLTAGRQLGQAIERYISAAPTVAAP
jgi:hypothetical protein